MKNVLLYCTQPILTAGLIRIMEDLGDFQLIDCCTSADSLKDEAENEQPELVMVEVTPEITLDVIRQLAGFSKGAPLVLWMDGGTPEFLAQALAAGVRGLLRKDQPIEDYGRCFRSVAAGEVWIDRGLASRLLGRRQVQVTRRERQLMGLLAQGLRNKEIAYSLGITEGTVKVYLSKLFVKVGASDRFDLALIALRNVEAHPGDSFKRFMPASAERAVPLTMPPFLSTTSFTPVAA
jgi:two-component system, NarL family, nitrate/nitrite response regulator NarL